MNHFEKVRGDQNRIVREIIQPKIISPIGFCKQWEKF
jgi:hypothetical protein